MAETQNSITIHAPAEEVFHALTDPRSIEQWRVPGEMTGKIHNYDFRVGGKYEMSLYYPNSDHNAGGKSGDNEDRFISEFIEIIPLTKIVEKVYFQGDDPAFNEPLTVQVDLNEVDGETKVTFSFKDIPSNIRPEDNEAGTISSLQKLARLVEQGETAKRIF